MDVVCMTVVTRRALNDQLGTDVVELELVPGVVIRTRTFEGRPILCSFNMGRLSDRTAAFELLGWKVEPFHPGDPRCGWPSHWTAELEARQGRAVRQRLARPEGPNHAWIATPPPRVTPPHGAAYAVRLDLDDLLGVMFEAEPKYELAA